MHTSYAGRICEARVNDRVTYVEIIDRGNKMLASIARGAMYKIPFIDDQCLVDNRQGIALEELCDYHYRFRDHLICASFYRVDARLEIRY